MAKAYVPQPGQRIAARNADNVAIQAAPATGTDFYTAAVAPKGANRFGFFVDVDSSTGTSPTLDIKFEISLDKGTTWATFPGGANTGSQAAMTQIDTTTGASFEYFEFAGDPEFTRLRAQFDFGGTSPSYDFGPTYWVFDHAGTY